MKTCTKCKVPKDEDEFYKDKRKPDGLKSWCKTCHLEDSRKRESKYNATRRKYREENKEESRLKKKNYYVKKKDAILASNKIWTQTKTGRLFSYIRSAKARGIEWNLTPEQFEELWQHHCYYCGDKITTIGIDRKDNSKGYEVENILPCCHVCNIMKRSMTVEEFKNHIEKIYNYGKF